MKTKKLLFTFLMTTILFVGAVLQVRGAQDAVLSLTAVPDNIPLNGETELTILVDTGSNDTVTTVQSYVNFDPSMLQVVGNLDLSASAFPLDFINSIDNTLGEIELSTSNNVSAQSGDNLIVATFTMQGIQEGTTQVSFDPDHVVVLLNDRNNTDVLLQTVPVTITIGSGDTNSNSNNNTNINDNGNENNNTNGGSSSGGTTSCNTRCNTLGASCGDGTTCMNVLGSYVCREPACESETDCSCDIPNPSSSSSGSGGGGIIYRHYSCVNNACMEVAGQGADECSIDADCLGSVDNLQCTTPMNVEADGGDGSITVYWDNTDSRVSEYDIHYGLESENYTETIHTNNRNIYTITGLEQGTTYYIALTSMGSECSESVYSNEVSVTTGGGGVTPTTTLDDLHPSAPILVQTGISLLFPSILLIAGVTIYGIRKKKIKI